MKHHSDIKKPVMLYAIGLIGFFSALHVSLTSYFNSSFLSVFAEEKTVSLIYLVLSLVTIVGLLAMNSILQKFGNLKTSIVLILLQIAVFYGIITSTSFSSIVIFFILGMSIINLVSFNIDVFLQKSTNIGNTGGVRGLYMTAINTAWILGPLIGGFLIVGNNYLGIYVAAFTMLFPLLYLIYKNFRDFKDSHYIKVSTRETISRILRNNDISKIFIINIVLQAFYAWMVIYVPIYLNKNIGFEWSEISIILTIMLIPFVLIEWPLGKLADRKYGEKEMMAMGFLVMAISTVALFLFTSKSLIIWSAMLFITRIGAAAAEVMIETYFFKKVDGKDPEILSMFRITRPISYLITPIIITIGLVYTTDQYLFVVIGVICFLTLYPILTIRDTN